MLNCIPTGDINATTQFNATIGIGGRQLRAHVADGAMSASSFRQVDKPVNDGARPNSSVGNFRGNAEC